MSHKATNWAVTVRGIPPASKIVLWHLADRHNKDTGQCNPSQDRLAHDCEMSRRSVNNHLDRLESAGLIKRVRSVNPITRRQENTGYILCFDVSKAQEPCADIAHGAVCKSGEKPCAKSGKSRVQNLHTNPVKEPVKEPRASAPLGDEERQRRCAQVSETIASLRERLQQKGLS